MKSWFKSKTMWVGFGVGVLGLLQTTLADAPLDPQIAGLVASGLGAVMMFLRSITSDELTK